MTETPATAGDLDPEDAKILRLARTARQRAYVTSGAGEGAAARDTEGRTYAAATVQHSDPSLTTTALRGALVAALSSGARTFEAFAVVGEQTALSDEDRDLLAEIAAGVPVLIADGGGSVVATETP